MATQQQATPAADERRETPRIQLARLAASAALEHADVTGADPARTHATHAGSERLPGVTVMPEGGEAGAPRYAVALYLVAGLTDLPVLAAQVESQVRRAADAEGLGGAISAIHITFTDLTLPELKRTAHA
ncbi:MAG: hypothetical protein JHD16_08740 [Solirubrobacteraceae bacterium]|nr:hypothetical protein [Solirubrobacteraceae bacterium]